MKQHTFKVLAGDFPKETSYTYLLGKQYISYVALDAVNDEIMKIEDMNDLLDNVCPLKDQVTVYGQVREDEIVLAMHMNDGREAIVLTDMSTYHHLGELAGHISYNVDYASSIELVQGGQALLTLKNSF